MRSRFVLGCLLGIIVGLAACGGEGGFDLQGLAAPVSPSAVPPSATAENAGATAAPSAFPSPSPRPAVPGIVTIAAVGDVMLGRSIGDRILGDGPGIPFEHVAGTLSGASIAVANLEGPVAPGGVGAAAAKGYTFLGPPAGIEALSLAGIDVVSLANNHSLDFGPEALAETIRLLDQAGIAHAGAGANAAEARSPAVIRANGLRIAFLAYVDTPAEGDYSRANWEAGETAPGVAWLDTAYFTTDMPAARRSADLVVVLLHFGREFHPEPTAEQRAQAQAAIDAGADLVLGAHPHLLQSVEEYGGGLIAYSMGNFVFDGFDGASNESAILLVELTADGATGHELLAVEIVDNGIPRLRDEAR